MEGWRVFGESMAGKIIERDKDPFAFEQALFILSDVVASYRSLELTNFQTDTLVQKRFDTDKFVRLIDSNKNGSFDCTDRLAKDTRLFSGVKAILAKHMSSYLPPLISCDETTSGGEIRYSSVVYIEPLKPRENPANESVTAITVRLADGISKTIPFYESRSGIGNSLTGPSIEEQYDKFVEKVALTFGFDESKAFAVIKETLRDIRESKGERRKRDILLGLFGLSSYGASVYFATIWSETKMEFLVDKAKCAALLAQHDRAKAAVASAGSSGAGGSVENLRRVQRSFLENLRQANSAFKARWGANEWEIHRPPPLPKTQRFLALRFPTTWHAALINASRIAGWAFMFAPVWAGATYVKDKYWPSEETRLRQNMEALFSDNVTYDDFHRTLEKYPALRTDIRKLWWFMNTTGLVREIEKYKMR